MQMGPRNQGGVSRTFGDLTVAMGHPTARPTPRMAGGPQRRPHMNIPQAGRCRAHRVFNVVRWHSGNTSAGQFFVADWSRMVRKRPRGGAVSGSRSTVLSRGAVAGVSGSGEGVPRPRPMTAADALTNVAPWREVQLRSALSTAHYHCQLSLNRLLGLGRRQLMTSL